MILQTISIFDCVGVKNISFAELIICNSIRHNLLIEYIVSNIKLHSDLWFPNLEIVIISLDTSQIPKLPIIGVCSTKKFESAIRDQTFRVCFYYCTNIKNLNITSCIQRFKQTTLHGVSVFVQAD